MTKLIHVIQSLLDNSKHCLENFGNTLLECWIGLPLQKFYLMDRQSVILSNLT